jgi:hypothetical protein
LGVFDSYQAASQQLGLIEDLLQRVVISPAGLALALIEGPKDANGGPQNWIFSLHGESPPFKKRKRPPGHPAGLCEQLN